MAELINCPVLSPSSFTLSMPSIISWAMRAVTDCDFAFLGPVAIYNLSCFWCKTIYTKKNYFEVLTCKTLSFYIVSYTLNLQSAETTKPGSASTLTGLLTKPLIEVTIMANKQHTQTHPKFIYTFTALHREHMADGATTVHVAADSLADARRMVKEMGYIAAFWKGCRKNVVSGQTPEFCFTWRFIALSTAQPRVIHIVAPSEREAREQAPEECVVIFTGRFPAKEANHA
ncbi:host cell division inhibitor Icd-like protein [Salmonella enterica subsp. enterica serovar Oranienburg]|nr:host cell division inhibitor Icd-like protein [Salmonella enterica]EBC7102206.1 host cell division inhibitor Icd-like protein [Salmonella enterica]ECS7055128.1 host cell division inhibitor Icd-like protein [Salmonella enterica subsp. enterica serovar Oranienburg]ECZ4191643.1 host cell division inhibitor Icd-like protein [Salmonella enterica]EEE1622076.1 host cell division inhibitor Icd-like protein [Salmonella enterica subsp. enterica serovar Oranienburg]